MFHPVRLGFPEPASTMPAQTPPRKAQFMALFMDAHTIGGPVTIDDVAKAHAADLQAQDAYGVH